MAGAYDLAVACGVESMTRAPMASNARGGDGPFSSDFLDACDGQLKAQFEVAQRIADDWKIGHDEMDEWALESHRRAAMATDSGAFAREIVPVPGADGQLVATDEGIRRDSSKAKLAALQSAQSWALARDITAGNSSQVSDGAAAVLIASRERPSRSACGRGRCSATSPWARTARSGADRAQPRDTEASRTYRPVRAGLRRHRGQRGVVTLAWAREFLPDMARLNARGGAIALGHPLGASGVRLLTTLLNVLEDTGGRLGFQTMCEGRGQANATVIERLG